MVILQVACPSLRRGKPGGVKRDLGIYAYDAEAWRASLPERGRRTSPSSTKTEGRVGISCAGCWRRRRRERPSPRPSDTPSSEARDRMERGSSRAGYNRSAKLRTLYFIIIVVYRANLANLGSSARARSRQHSSEPSAGVPLASHTPKYYLAHGVRGGAAHQSIAEVRVQTLHAVPHAIPRYLREGRYPRDARLEQHARRELLNLPRGRVGSSSASSSTAECSALAFGSRPTSGDPRARVATGREGANGGYPARWRVTVRVPPRDANRRA